MKKEFNKKFSVIALIFLMSFAAVLAGCKAEEPVEEPPPPPPSDPLTGALVEEGFDESALNRRITAFVVENTPDARPQWGLDDENYSPDIVLQGEVEGGITRTLWFYSDYNKLPEVIGPTRSARPPFIKFSELFDSIFIHWGMSYSKGDYVGANKIFQWHEVDHINQMTLDDKEGMYDRDQTRDVSSEHTGIIYGAKVPATIKNEGFRAEPGEVSKLYFFEEKQPVSTETASKISVVYSKETDWESTDWEYNEEDQKYHTKSFDNDFARDNLLILYDDTEYITKENYHGGGGSVTYCDYLFKGGRAQLFTQGSVKEIQWQRKSGYLLLIDPEKNATEIYELNNDKDKENDDKDSILVEVPLNDDELAEAEKKKAEAEEAGEEYVPEMYVAQPINKGKTWIGWVSQNNGCNVTVTPGEYTLTMPGTEEAAGEEAASEENKTDN